MEIDEEIEVKGPAVSGRRTSRRQLVTEAIDLAMESRWQDAVNANQRLVNLIPDDVESYNRLGKALTELGRITDARDAYDKALKADPANPIAQRNRDRLQLISETEAAELIKRASQKLEPRFFMEETGKTGVTMLQDVAKSDVLLTLSAGERVGLDGQSGTLEVTTLDGVRIGAVE
ncbi:MAG: tetratricopeptide repeat protein [Chloroflexota bacterium]